MFISITCDVSPFVGFARFFDPGLLIRRYQLHKYFRQESILNQRRNLVCLYSLTTIIFEANLLNM